MHGRLRQRPPQPQGVLRRTGVRWVKTANKNTVKPMVRLAVRGVSGGWSAYTFSNVEDGQSRPRVLIDEGNGWVYVLGTKPELGAAIFYKRANLDRIAFDPGPGHLPHPDAHRSSDQQRDVDEAVGHQ